MSTSHTPGPWLHRVKSDSVHLPPDDSRYIYGNQIFRFDEEAAPSDADLRLILAAPDLLETLLDALPELESVGPLSKFERARAAIAKATGEQA